jgi:hypothetical protein
MGPVELDVWGLLDHDAGLCGCDAWVSEKLILKRIWTWLFLCVVVRWSGIWILRMIWICWVCPAYLQPKCECKSKVDYSCTWYLLLERIVLLCHNQYLLYTM